MTIDVSTATYLILLGRWVSWVVRHARLVVLTACAVTTISAWYFLDNLAINTGTSDMLSEKLPFRQKSAEMDRAFPQTDSTMVVVIEGQTADIADDAVGWNNEMTKLKNVLRGKDEVKRSSLVCTRNVAASK